MNSAVTYTSRVIKDLSDIDAGEWNALCPGRQPFIRHEFLSAMERHRCVGPETGWVPHHLALYDRENKLAGAMPLYLKTHSWGEFIFDFAWAQAYLDAGRNYYPKLVAMCPFTPVTGRRILTDSQHPAAAEQLISLALSATRDAGASSMHVLFPENDELPGLQEAAMLRRDDVRFLWRNRDYKTFDSFLQDLRSNKRKKIRRERLRIAEQNIVVQTMAASELSENDFESVYQLCARTFLRRGNQPYLSLEFFQSIAPLLQDQMLVNLARIDQEIVGAAILFRDDTTLYGRYWGGLDGLDCLHFETCYYRGIEYCIDNGLTSFDPGTQGEHKLSRGFSPVTTLSTHWLADQSFHAAVARYLLEERKHVADYKSELIRHRPFRADLS
ncbi:MAG: GNAT family N-acetyltransferase [Gammaproteobacteria bacterium]|nr:GNAT family N-acetyltransferase [Gammaproteobacteria bacterium]